MDINFLSTEWLAIAKYIAAEQQKAREKNDNPDLTPEQTAALRGELRLMKRLLGLPQQSARARAAGSVDLDSFGGGDL